MAEMWSQKNQQWQKENSNRKFANNQNFYHSWQNHTSPEHFCHLWKWTELEEINLRAARQTASTNSFTYFFINQIYF